MYHVLHLSYVIFRGTAKEGVAWSAAALRG
jgi:hypothetical protein